MQKVFTDLISVQTPEKLHVMQGVLKFALETKLLCCQAGIYSFTAHQDNDKQVQNHSPGSLIECNHQ